LPYICFYFANIFARETFFSAARGFFLPGETLFLLPGQVKHRRMLFGNVFCQVKLFLFFAGAGWTFFFAGIVFVFLNYILQSHGRLRLTLYRWKKHGINFASLLLGIDYVTSESNGSGTRGMKICWQWQTSQLFNDIYRVSVV
jgi:hypothetical protein